MPRSNEWRDTAQTTRLWLFDALSGIPLILMLAHIRWYTVLIAFLAFVIFGILEKFGYSVPVAIRRLRTKLAGPVKQGHAWWHRHQERI
ncbi:IcmT/TraK family protein [Xanthomonas euvesicatoria]